MKDLIHSLVDQRLANYASDELGNLADTYQECTDQLGAEEAWAKFVDVYELGNWIYEQAIMADINLPELLIDTQTVRSLQEQQAAEDMEERRLEYRSSVGGGSL